MTHFLLFTLYAPMGSFGEIAVGERRMGWSRPGRSAILGLIAAALGIERVDEAAHRNLEAGFFYAVRTDAPGRPFIDYHTAQTPKARRGRTFATRREELEADDLHTVLSSREWRSDACFTIALWPRHDQAVNLSEIVDALWHPGFALYLGRKAAPLGLPLNPAIIEAATFMDALAARKPTEVEEALLGRIRVGTAAGREIAFDHDAPDAPTAARIERRRDAVVSRERWQFSDRLEGVIEPEGGAG